MKKIALLLLITCAGHLYGMEPENKPDYIASLPKEVQGLIIVNLQTGKDLDSTIRTLIATSRTNKALNQIINEKYGNLKGYTALVHTLASKFNASPYAVASLFNTPIAQEYLKLADQLQEELLQYSGNAKIKKLIAQGVDVNFYGGPIPRKSDRTPLNQVIKMYGGEIIDRVKLLLAAGANPLLKDSESHTTFDQVLISREELERYPSSDRLVIKHNMELRDIEILLEEAVQKQ